MKLAKSLGILVLTAGIACGAFADDAMKAAPAATESGTVSSVPAAPSTTQTPETSTTTSTSADSQTYSKENCAKMMENCKLNKEVESVCDMQVKKCQEQLVKENMQKMENMQSGTTNNQ